MTPWTNNKPVSSVKLGNIYEIETSLGYYYIQYINFDKLMGYLVRLIDHRFDERQTDSLIVGNIATKYSFFYALPATIKHGVCRLIGNAQIPEADRAMPDLVSQMHMRPETPAKWEIIHPDGSSYQLNKLTKAQKNLPIWSIPSHPTVVRRLLEGWTPEQDHDLYQLKHSRIE